MTNRTVQRAAFNAMQNNPPARNVLYKYSFVYGGIILGLSEGSTGSVNIPIQADSDFMMQQLNLAVYDTTSGGPVTESTFFATFNITDTGSGATLFSTPLPTSSLTGNGNEPFIFPVSRLWAKNSNLTVTVNNIKSGTHACDYFFSLIGHKLFMAGE